MFDASQIGMLQRLPTAVGRALQGVRPGLPALVVHRDELRTVSATLVVTSSALDEMGRLAAVHTADGKGTSPPIAWNAPPPGTQSLTLIVEDADSPTPKPLVHAIAWGISPDVRELAAGDLDAKRHDRSTHRLGLSSYLKRGWLPPDPPPGHGPHRYAIQVFALDSLPRLGERAGRRAVVESLRGRTLATGLLIATYAR